MKIEKKLSDIDEKLDGIVSGIDDSGTNNVIMMRNIGKDLEHNIRDIVVDNMNDMAMVGLDDMDALNAKVDEMIDAYMNDTIGKVERVCIIAMSITGTLWFLVMIISIVWSMLR